MKPLEKLINTEKARLLHELFPGEMPAFLQQVSAMSQTIKEDEEMNRAKWEDGLMSFDFWLQQVNEAERLIGKYGKRLEDSSKLFSEQLFDGYLAIYLVHCLVVYTTVRKHPNRKFSIAIDLLFNP